MPFRIVRCTGGRSRLAVSSRTRRRRRTCGDIGGVAGRPRGGSGKSTTAICCVDAGMEYVGDDYVLLTREPVPRRAQPLSLGENPHFVSAKGAAALAGSGGWPDWSGTKIAPVLARIPAASGGDRLTIRGVVQPKVTAAVHSRESPRSRSRWGCWPSPLRRCINSPKPQHATLSFFAGWMRTVPAFRLLATRGLI